MMADKLSVEDTLTLLKVGDLSRPLPKLKAIHDRAMRLLEEAAVVVAEEEAKLANERAQAKAKADAEAAAKKVVEDRPKQQGFRPPFEPVAPLDGGTPERPV